ncbi:MAG TPA: diacylglycerol kinase family protein [Pyrinomonadaceae bacterium]|jgi:YegS/Rv2252/BmrU family lipid kinase|nr:diacylglycerol kinase family protein [Pyrinomonadaceae bacterium]
MSHRRHAVLISNPHAGRGGARRSREVLRFCELLKKRDVMVEVLDTRGPGDAEHLARRVVLEGAREVIISGGDGTINEALQGLVGTETRLGIWPSGTANVLARELGLPFNLERLVETIARASTQRIFLGCALKELTGEKRYFCLMAGIGLDASIVRAIRPRMKRRIGKAAFWYTGLGHLAHWQPVPFNIEVERQSFPATFAAIGKAAHYGGDLSITPHARLDQPEFEICLINSQSRLRYLHLLSHAMRGGMKDSAHGARLIRTTSARAVGPTSVQVDGELLGDLPMSFEIAPHSIQVIVGESGV